MKHPIRIRSVLFFISLPALWLGSFSISEQISVFEQSAPNFEFVPVTVRASHFADYSPDTFINDFAPVDEDIVVDAQADQGLTSPSLPLPAVQDPNIENDSDDSQDQEDDSQREAAPTPGNSGQGPTGETGNKEKDADSPGNSGTDHGNGGNGNGSGGNGKNQ